MKVFWGLILLATVLSAQTLEIINSEFLPSADTTLVFSPNSEVTNEKLPLVILLHGWSGNYKQWSSNVDLQKFSDVYNFIIACPDGFYDSWYINNPNKNNLMYEDFFINDFLPYIIKKYNVDEKNVFISGLSMGGHGAITFLLKYPEKFKSAGSTSGVLDLTMYPDRWTIKEGIGEYTENKDLWKNNSAYYLLESIAGTDKEIIFDCGIDDFIYQSNFRFFEKTLNLKIKATFISQPGNHSHAYWKKSIPAHFDFFKRISME
ncbi:MAG: esterase [Ignavibacteriae bacterium]|nr:esterase [Ignavibacteriota bacterium]